MKSLVVLSCVIAVAVASYVPADTPEVAAAKAQHFAAHQQAQARNWAQDVVVNRQWVAAAPSWNALWTSRAADWYAPSWQRWYNPAQISVVNGQVQDTPEVAAEKAKHFALYAEAQARSASAGGDDGEWVDDVHVAAAPVVSRNYVNYVTPGVSHVTSYAAPAVSHTWVAAARHHEPANIVVANGHVQDTPEVAAEKAKHFSLVAEAQARNAAAGSTEWADNVEAWKAWGSPAAVSTYAAVAPVVSSVYPSWTRVAQPAHVVVANGHVQDTPEVAAEKAKHLALVAQTKLRDAAAGSQVEWSDDVVAPVVAPVVHSRVAAVAPVVHSRVAAVAPVAVAAADVHSQYHAQDEAGQYSYGYNGGLSTKNEEKTVDGVTRGAYSYVDANGLVQSRSYVADGLGFRVAATDLPQGPSPVNPIAPVATVYAAAPVAAPAVHLVSKHYQPAQVVVKADGTLEDTPEVAAAKAQHFAAVQQEHARHAGW